MHSLWLIGGQIKKTPPANSREPNHLEEELQDDKRRSVDEFPVLIPTRIEWDDAHQLCGSGEFFKGFSPQAKSDFASLATRLDCPAATVLIGEEQAFQNVLFLLDGKVNISMNSSDGRRFLLGVAGAGDILGITSAVSGASSEICAEARYPCRIASLRRQDFLDFLLRHPIACHNVARELSLHYARACARLRMLGLASSTSSRLAGLLLDWCCSGRQTNRGTQIHCDLTHQEIGECIGASRETVTRSLNDFKNQGLIELRGTIMNIPSCRALASYAGIGSTPDPFCPAA